MKKALTGLFAGLAVATGAPGAGAANNAADFSKWIGEFRETALGAGVSGETYDAAFAGVILNERVLQLNDRQPEFTRAIWDYLDGAVSETRIEKGRTLRAEHKTLLNKIEAEYGVSADVMTAIWGLESSYGAIMGDHDIIGALATLGFEGRRTAYGRSQLIGALRILENGYADKSDLRGSWAGAMGQTQFIPTTYLDYAVDHNADGKRDLWGDLEDVFASTANYLRASDWRTGATWGFEVALPDNFDYANADRNKTKMIATWLTSGVTLANGESIATKADLNAQGAIIAPAGAQGPKFMILQNFRAILKYNNSTAYALAIGLLSDEIAADGGPLVATWPRDERPLSRLERVALQEALLSRGYNTGPADGIIGANTRRALRAYQADNGLTPDGFATASLLARLQGGATE